METKKQNLLVLTAAVMISAGIWMSSANHHSPTFNSRTFKVMNGWGYDVLVNDTVIIHQESVPVLQRQQAFALKEQAEKTAQLIIQKLKKGTLPTLTKFELEKILGPDEINNDRHPKLE